MNDFCHMTFIRKKQKQKGWQKREKENLNDLVCGQYTNTCKLGAKWHGQDFKTIKVDDNNFTF
jgi:hypothetical protein